MKRNARWISFWFVMLLAGGMGGGLVSAASPTPDLELAIIKAPNYQSPSCTITDSTTAAPGGTMSGGGIDHASHHRPLSALPQISYDEARKTTIINQMASSTTQVMELLRTLDEISKNENKVLTTERENNENKN